MSEAETDHNSSVHSAEYQSEVGLGAWTPQSEDRGSILRPHRGHLPECSHPPTPTLPSTYCQCSDGEQGGYLPLREPLLALFLSFIYLFICLFTYLFEPHPLAPGQPPSLVLTLQMPCSLRRANRGAPGAFEGPKAYML